VLWVTRRASLKKACKNLQYRSQKSASDRLGQIWSNLAKLSSEKTKEFQLLKKLTDYLNVFIIT